MDVFRKVVVLYLFCQMVEILYRMLSTFLRLTDTRALPDI